MNADFVLVVNFCFSVLSSVLALVTSIWLLAVPILGFWALRKLIITFKQI